MSITSHLPNEIWNYIISFQSKNLDFLRTFSCVSKNLKDLSQFYIEKLVKQQLSLINNERKNSKNDLKDLNLRIVHPKKIGEAVPDVENLFYKPGVYFPFFSTNVLTKTFQKSFFSGDTGKFNSLELDAVTNFENDIWLTLKNSKTTFIYVLDELKNFKKLIKFPKNLVSHVLFEKDFIIGINKKYLHVWNQKNGQLLFNFQTPQHPKLVSRYNSIKAVVVYNKMLYAGTQDGSVVKYDLNNGEIEFIKGFKSKKCCITTLKVMTCFLNYKDSIATSILFIGYSKGACRLLNLNNYLEVPFDGPIDSQKENIFSLYKMGTWTFLSPREKKNFKIYNIDPTVEEFLLLREKTLNCSNIEFSISDNEQTLFFYHLLDKCLTLEIYNPLRMQTFSFLKPFPRTEYFFTNLFFCDNNLILEYMHEKDSFIQVLDFNPLINLNERPLKRIKTE